MLIVICFDVYMYKAGKDGLIGDNCELCPEMYFGSGSTLQFNCTKGQWYHVAGCLQSPSKGTCTILFKLLKLTSFYV